MICTRVRKHHRTSERGFLRSMANLSIALLLPAALLAAPPGLALAGPGFRSMHGGAWSHGGGFNQGFAAPQFRPQPSFGGGFRPGGFNSGFAAPQYQPQPSFGGGFRPGGFNPGFAAPQYQPQPSFGGGFRPGGLNQGFAAPQFQPQPSFGGGFRPALASPRTNFQPAFSTPARSFATPGIVMNPYSGQVRNTNLAVRPYTAPVQAQSYLAARPYIQSPMRPQANIATHPVVNNTTTQALRSQLRPTPTLTTANVHRAGSNQIHTGSQLSPAPASISTHLKLAQTQAKPVVHPLAAQGNRPSMTNHVVNRPTRPTASNATPNNAHVSQQHVQLSPATKAQGPRPHTQTIPSHLQASHSGTPHPLHQNAKTAVTGLKKKSIPPHLNSIASTGPGSKSSSSLAGTGKAHVSTNAFAHTNAHNVQSILSHANQTTAHTSVNNHIAVANHTSSKSAITQKTANLAQASKGTVPDRANHYSTAQGTLGSTKPTTSTNHTTAVASTLRPGKPTATHPNGTQSGTTLVTTTTTSKSTVLASQSRPAPSTTTSVQSNNGTSLRSAVILANTQKKSSLSSSTASLNPSGGLGLTTTLASLASQYVPPVVSSPVQNVVNALTPPVVNKGVNSIASAGNSLASGTTATLNNLNKDIFGPQPQITPLPTYTNKGGGTTGQAGSGGGSVSQNNGGVPPKNPGTGGSGTQSGGSGVNQTVTINLPGSNPPGGGNTSNQPPNTTPGNNQPPGGGGGGPPSNGMNGQGIQGLVSSIVFGAFSAGFGGLGGGGSAGGGGYDGGGSAGGGGYAGGGYAGGGYGDGGGYAGGGYAGGGGYDGGGYAGGGYGGGGGTGGYAGGGYGGYAGVGNAGAGYDGGGYGGGAVPDPSATGAGDSSSDYVNGPTTPAVYPTDDSSVSPVTSDAVVSDPSGATAGAVDGGGTEPNLPFVSSSAQTYDGQVIGDGQSMSFVSETAGVPPASAWKEGPPVKGNNIPQGTAIATFDENGNFMSSASGGNAAIYDSQDQNGIWLWDQRNGQPVHRRYIRSTNGIGSPANDGDSYYVIRR
jgi:hypothetical protein